VPPGDYRFHVVACNEDGVWNEAGCCVALVLLPHAWQTWWFTPFWVGALVVGVAASTVLAVRRRHKRRIAQLEQLRALESERMRIARDIHDDLGASMTQIALLSELAQTDLEQPAQARGHIEEIFTTARRVARSVDEIVWAISPKNDALEVSLAYICKNVQDSLRAAGINCQIEMPEELPARSLSSAARHHLFLAMREALNNVIKHARASEVRLRLGVESGALTVVIADNGRGFSPGAAPGSALASGRASHGLESMAHRLEAVGGRFELQSQPGQGTVVQLAVPLRQTGDAVG
jgi:signal transduction histidine kinase